MYAGPRYLKRGINDEGYVANEVEVETVVEDEFGHIAAHTQVRGSIPGYWKQDVSVAVPRPPIQIVRNDPLYRTFTTHISLLLRRYSAPIQVLDLVKTKEKHPRESLVAALLRDSCAFLNQRTPPGMQISYWHVDFADIAKHSSVDNPLLHDILSRYARSSLELPRFSRLTGRSTGFFASYISPSARRHARSDEASAAAALSEALRSALLESGHLEQRGVLRSNCIDCLDRTNVAQFFLSFTAVYHMLFTLGIADSPGTPDTSPLQQILVEMYKDLGDVISLQYGGSNAHDKIDVTRGNKKKKDFLTTILRHYNNAFTDKVKQESINVFLGVVDPLKHAQIISITNAKPNYDYYLHNRGYLQNDAVSIQVSPTWWETPVVAFEQALLPDLPAFLQASPALPCRFCRRDPVLPAALCCAFCGALLPRRLPALHRGDFYAVAHETGLVCEQLVRSDREWKRGNRVSGRTQLCELDRLLAVPCLVPHYLSTVATRRRADGIVFPGGLHAEHAGEAALLGELEHAHAVDGAVRGRFGVERVGAGRAAPRGRGGRRRRRRRPQRGRQSRGSGGGAGIGTLCAAAGERAVAGSGGAARGAGRGREAAERRAARCDAV